MIRVTHCATAQDGRPYHVHTPLGLLRLTWEEAKDLYADLGIRLAESDARIDTTVEEFKASDVYLYRDGVSPW